MSTHTTIGNLQYAAGDWYIVAKENGFVLLPGQVAVSTLERVWAALDSGRIAAVIDAMTATAGAPLSAVPPFAIAIGHGADLRVAVRGDVRVVYDDGSRQELITGGRMETWVEQELPAHAALLVTPPESQIDETLLPLVSGIARTGLVAVGTQEHHAATTATASAASVASTVDAAAIDAPAPADAEQGERATADHGDGADADDAAAGADVDAADVDAADVDAADMGPADVDGADVDRAPADGAGMNPAEVDPAHVGSADPDPADSDPADADDADADGNEPEPDPEAAGRHDMTVDGISGDHDGHTVEQSFLEAARAAGLVPDTDPDAATTAAGYDDAREFFAEFGIGQDGDSAADDGDAVARDGRAESGRVVLSTGAVLELGRPLLVGRRPRIEQSTSDDIPELITVASPTHDISRNHVEIRRDGEAITVTDLNTTNGTMLLREGDGPLRLHPGEPTMVISGDVLDIGDDVTLRFEDIP